MESALQLIFPILLVLGCDGVVGSASVYDDCGVCGGDNSSCGLVSGLFTKPHLPPGYSHITTIPKDACSITVRLARHTKNHAAVRTVSGAGYIINNSPTGEYQGVGTVFTYTRGDTDTMEILTADGPIDSPIELELIAVDINKGVEYRYMLPTTQGDQLPQPARSGGKNSRRHSASQQYRWTLKTLTQCSRSCGGGYQRTLALCVKKSGQRVVPDRKCKKWPKPSARSLRCNRSPCPPEWEAGEWGMCSTTCGEGMQKRRVTCKQELSESLTIPVAQELCTLDDDHDYVTERKCFVTNCDERVTTIPTIGTTADFTNHYQNYQAWNNNKYPQGYKKYVKHAEKDGELLARKARTYFSKIPNQLNDKVIQDGDTQEDNNIENNQIAASATWVAQAWGSCSVTCGEGVRERRVHCVDTRGGLVPDGRCSLLSRPSSESYCNLGPCILTRWLVSQWDMCTAQCGVGEVHRRVTCMGQCEESTKPHTKEDCHAPKPCKGEWLTGRWTVCSHTCGEGTQSRKVVCTVGTDRGTEVASEEHCQDRRKPKVERQCNFQKCSASWFTGDWSQCSQSCGQGEKTREVVCLFKDRISQDCHYQDRPQAVTECQEQHCGDSDADNIIEVGVEDDHLEEEGSGHSVSNVSSSTSSPSSIAWSNEILAEKHWKMGKGEGCKDKFKNCNVVVQSRLCKYSFYQNNCCRSCRTIANQPTV